MVVVADGIGFEEKPLSRAGSNPYLRECLRQNKPRRMYHHNKVVVVAGVANICARVSEQIDDNAVPKTVLFSQKALASQLYHAVSHLYEEYPSPDSFNLVLMYNKKKYPLVFENKPIPDLNIAPISGLQYADIGMARVTDLNNGDHQVDEPMEVNHKPASPEKIEKINYQIFDVTPQEDGSSRCWSFLVSPSTTFRELDDNMLFLSARSTSQTTIHLHYQKTGQNTSVYARGLSSLQELNTTFADASFDFSQPNQTFTIHLPIEIIKESESKPRCCLDDNYLLQEIFPIPSTSGNFTIAGIDYKMSVKYKSEIEAKPEISYVGLVNQAMTCYLNSLLQALYMTPEFRNALYNWEYVDGPDKEKAIHSIPYQLQKLFLNLQTSAKAAVETTSLTKSFGWDSTEAWQQHDIQELCRVMFDALEQKFKNTQQADLINRLYEGQMIDYVRCLECSTEKSRKDTFLDIPLPVKPFGSNVAYNSVEEALRAFVQPETLDGVNQYFCENCNKKCNAHKGLKFTKFPYLLTLHLKRFDFDYNTFHRIKLNDKVTFPDVLNLNSFIPSHDQASPMAEEDADVGVKCDDGSTTDSSNLDECSPCNGMNGEPSELSHHEQDDDEGIDMSNGPSTCSTDQEIDNQQSTSGPYRYELFSIMIHSGSASGGHYYAYIKDFRTNEWLCFNDQNVAPITDDDIQKTYGGGPTRGYYSGVYSSSTNAYMLMYRQIDGERNCLPMEMNDFPKHIQELLVKIKIEEEERRTYERPTHMSKFKVYLHHPTENVMKTRHIFSMRDETLNEMVEKTYRACHLDGIVDVDQCRLVTYHAESDTVVSMFDEWDHETLETLFPHGNPDMLLDIRKKDEPFKRYPPGGIGSKVFILDCIKRQIIDGPIYVRSFKTQTVGDYKDEIASFTAIDPSYMLVAMQKPMLGTSDIKILSCNNQLLSEVFVSGNRVFVTDGEGHDEAIIEQNLLEMAFYFNGIISLYVLLPDVTEEILEELNIPSLEGKLKQQKEQKDQKKLNENTEDNQKTKPEVGESSQKDDNWFPFCKPKDKDEWYEQSNSEDSSLSDSDRTLIGDASEEDESAPVTSCDAWLGQNGKQDTWENDQDELEPDYFFKAIPYNKDNIRYIRVLVDKKMKFAPFKKHLEPYVGVPVEWFKVIRHAGDAGDIDYARLTAPLRIWEDGEKISIKLGRALRANEFRVNIYFLNIKNMNNIMWTVLFEWTISKDSTVATVKKQLLAELKRKHIQDVPFDRCRLRKKNFQTPSKVLLNDQKIKDCGFQSQCELIIQELDEDDPVTSPNQIVVVVNRMYSYTENVFSAMREIVLEEKCYKELTQKLCDWSKIEIDNLEVAKGKWPGDLYGSKRQWTKITDYPWPCINIEDGACIFYRDAAEKWDKHPETRFVMKKSRYDSEKNHLQTTLPRDSQVSRVSNYSDSPRRERALKIYLDDK